MAAKTRKPVRVTVTISLDVDPEEWNHEYGDGTSAAMVRASVKSYIAGHVTSAMYAEGSGNALSNITWK